MDCRGWTRRRARSDGEKLEFDPRYEHFLSLLTQQIGTAIDTARAGEDARRRAEALAEIDATSSARR